MIGGDRGPVKARNRCCSREVDAIVWTKNEPSLATPAQVFLTDNSRFVWRPSIPCSITSAPGETEAGSAGENPPSDNPAEGTPQASGPDALPTTGRSLPLHP